MLKLPPWDTPAWRLPRELRPFYAAVNRLHQLEANYGASPAEITAARHAVGVAGVQLVRHVDAIRLFKAKRATVRYFGRA
jgi:hypothetical protein